MSKDDNRTKRTRRPGGREWRRSSRKRNFIDALKETGVVLHACEQAGVPRSTVYEWYDDDADFAWAWEEAIEISNERIDQELFERAVIGQDQQLITVHQGEEGGSTTTQTWVKKKSDNLLKFIAQSRNPERYAERHAVEHSGKVARWDIPIPEEPEDKKTSE